MFNNSSPNYSFLSAMTEQRSTSQKTSLPYLNTPHQNSHSEAYNFRRASYQRLQIPFYQQQQLPQMYSPRSAKYHYLNSPLNDNSPVSAPLRMLGSNSFSAQGMSPIRNENVYVASPRIFQSVRRASNVDKVSREYETVTPSKYRTQRSRDTGTCSLVNLDFETDFPNVERKTSSSKPVSLAMIDDDDEGNRSILGVKRSKRKIRLPKLDLKKIETENEDCDEILVPKPILKKATSRYSISSSKEATPTPKGQKSLAELDFCTDDSLATIQRRKQVKFAE